MVKRELSDLLRFVRIDPNPSLCWTQ